MESGKNRWRISVNDPLGPLDYRHPDLLERLMRRAPGPEPVGALPEVRFEDRLQDQVGGLLHDPVADPGDPATEPIWRTATRSSLTER